MFLKNIPVRHSVCEQPACALRQGHMSRPRLADLLIRALSKKNSIDRIPERARITPRSVCVECAQRVIRGHKPLLTMAERDQIFADSPPEANHHTH